MVYLNHAATTYPKPEVVKEAVLGSITALPQSQYRGVTLDGEKAHRIELCRTNLARLFSISDPGRIYFTSGSTMALNMGILGLCTGRREIVVTATEHNGVLRTVMDGLKEKLGTGVFHLTIVPCDGDGYVDMDQMKQVIQEDTALVAVNHCSNVTGAVQDIAAIGAWCREAGACFLVDASQSAGVLPVDVEAMNIDLLAFTAHKGLYGIEGSGGLYIRQGIPIRPLCYGGTGSDSRTILSETPFYEVGTANQPGIDALCAGVEYVLGIGIDRIMEKEQDLMTKLYHGLKACKGVKVLASRQPQGTALSFLIDGLDPSDVGYILSGTFKIVVRTGLHCAPLIHPYLGTEKKGTVRVSISYMTTEEEIEYFLESVRSLCKGVLGNSI